MSTIRVNNLQNTSTTDGGISINASGHVTVDGVAMPSAGPLSNRNLIINGAMQVAQRGTSSTASDYGTVDRFFTSFGGGAVTTTQESLTSGDPYDEGFRNFARLTNTTSTTGTSSYRLLVQQVEAQNIANSGWNYASATSYITLSFWIRSSVSQAFSVRLRSFDGTSQNYPMSTGTLTANTWTKVTKTIPGNSNITINNDNGHGLRVEFGAFWGTDYTDSGVTLDAWAAFASGTRTTDITNTWAGTTNATFDLTGVQLEVGSVATPFEHRSVADELFRCQRYFVSFDQSAYSFSARGASGGGLAVYAYPLQTPLRASPTITTGTGFSNRAFGPSGFSDSTTAPIVATNGFQTNACSLKVTQANHSITDDRAACVQGGGVLTLSSEL